MGRRCEREFGCIHVMRTTVAGLYLCVCAHVFVCRDLIADAGINKDNAAAFMWRGAASAAERLWSPQALTPSHAAAFPRFSEHLCRLALLGVRAGPIGPNFCPADSQSLSASAALAALEVMGDGRAEWLTLSRSEADVVRAALRSAAAAAA